MQTNQLSVLEVFEQGLTKTSIHCMAQNAIDAVKEKGNVLQVAEAISAMEAFIKEVKADESFKEYTRDEISKYPKGFTSASGAKLECAETGTKYNFDNCNDPIYEDLQMQLHTLSGEIKVREAFLKTVPLSGLEIRYEDELITVFPPAKSSISSYKVTLSK